jgi:opacity protein-like surface antigen
MKKFLIAASIAVAALSSSYGAAHAQSVVITDGDSPDYYHHRHNNGYGDRREDDGNGERRGDRGWHRGLDRPRFEHARCMTRMETVQRHGHTVTRETRVCK